LFLVVLAGLRTRLPSRAASRHVQQQCSMPTGCLGLLTMLPLLLADGAAPACLQGCIQVMRAFRHSCHCSEHGQQSGLHDCVFLPKYQCQL
jgi:hypothetical protein